MTVYHPGIHDPILKRLFQCVMSDEQIAERMGMSWQTIRRNRERIGLGLAKKLHVSGKPSEPLPPLGPEPTSPVQIAKNVLGHRVMERNGCYLLDGTPIKAPDMVREANRVRIKRGQSPFGPEEWRK
ncbi:hypothetical protein [Zavarzinella formosa]|uniref:hypothetical protein n=1 Tax=Zavarzinella formosa TaxID=360055 RepID=UPI0002D465A1|nr:hypothetical protein [Zavarzinella formosa]